MVYEWENKRDECYDMYITENKSLEEIIEFYRGQNFAPRYVVDSRIPFYGSQLNNCTQLPRSLISLISLLFIRFTAFVAMMSLLSELLY